VPHCYRRPRYVLSGCQGRADQRVQNDRCPVGSLARRPAGATAGERTRARWADGVPRSDAEGAMAGPTWDTWVARRAPLGQAQRYNTAAMRRSGGSVAARRNVLGFERLRRGMCGRDGDGVCPYHDEVERDGLEPIRLPTGDPTRKSQRRTSIRERSVFLYCRPPGGRPVGRREVPPPGTSPDAIRFRSPP